jgi:CheY-like chemotaxis protein
MGTRVRVLIPRSEPAQGAGEAVAGLARRRSAGGLRLLLVDDNIDAASTLAMCLEAAGHHVVVAHEGQRALEAALASRPQACLLDIGLPGMDGYELGRRLKNLPEAAGATLIALTGYGGERDREASARAGFAHHMVKPVDLDRLGVLLAEVAQARA